MTAPDDMRRAGKDVTGLAGPGDSEMQCSIYSLHRTLLDVCAEICERLDKLLVDEAGDVGVVKPPSYMLDVVLTDGSLWRKNEETYTLTKGTEHQWYLMAPHPHGGKYFYAMPARTPLDAFGGDYADFEPVIMQKSWEGVMADTHRYRKALEEIAGLPPDEKHSALTWMEVRHLARTALDDKTPYSHS